MPFSSLICGKLADKSRKLSVLLSFILWSIALSLIFVFPPSLLPIIFLIYGFQYGAYDAIIRPYLIETLSKSKKGVGMSFYYLTNGILMSLSSIYVGLLWELISIRIAFFIPILLSSLSTLLFAFLT